MTEQQIESSGAAVIPEGIDYFDDVPPKEAEPATLELLTKLAHEQIDLEKQVNDDSVALAEKQERLNRLQRVRIPDIMSELGMEEFKLTDGTVISAKGDIKANITEANKPAAFKWLEEHDFDGIIKTNVAVQFGKGEMDDAKKAMDALKEAGFVGSMERSIHPSTLKSFVKEQLEKGSTEAGDSIPIETFGIFEFKLAKIKLPKAKK